MSFHKTASLQSYRIPVKRLFTSAAVSHLVHALSVPVAGRKHHKHRLQRTINMHIPPPPPSTTIADYYHTVQVTQVAMQFSYIYIPPHTSTTTTTDHHHTVQVAHHYRPPPCSASWPPPQTSTTQCKLPTTTQCKLLECMWSMCASGWKEKDHQCKLVATGGTTTGATSACANGWRKNATSTSCSQWPLPFVQVEYLCWLING